ncbi:hypothetical protein E4T52_09153 [Aureobasidium sp. EXF-3400]|nr:hypothetical protein E4T51_08280 [Aureobasidium sp. EXF-12344]KAI4775897.1 hypothetical protein E4T52_09153 [Aureobasidium sp. EXF-3400]
MTSTKELADTLPFDSPDNGSTARDPEHSSFSAYSLIPLDHDGQQRLLNDLNDGDWTTKQCVLATQPDFSGRTLRDIYDHHIEASREDNEMHPHLFIVADQDDWDTNGVLLVYVCAGRVLTRWDDDDYEDEYTVGVLRCAVWMADCICCNLEISKLDFHEFKEGEEREWDGEDIWENKRYSKYSRKTGELN